MRYETVTATAVLGLFCGIQATGQMVVRPDGFVDWVSEVRSGTTHDTVNTKFGSIPLAGTPDEALTSVAHSRVMLRTSNPIGLFTFNTYLEADFLQAADRAPWRWRQYWGEVKFGRWSLLGGQAWSLLRPNRDGNASDGALFNTLVVDPAYHVGLAGVRRRQFRLTRTFEHGNSAEVEWESGGRFQGRFTHDSASRKVHLEGTLFTGTRSRYGVGLSQGIAVKPWIRIIGAQFVAGGGGPEMLGILPPGVHAASVIEGIEMPFRGGDRTLYSYGGMVYGGRSSGNRFTRQYTFGGQKRMYQGTGGTLLWNTQFSQFDRAVWDGRSGSLTYLMTGIRYLPPPMRR